MPQHHIQKHRAQPSERQMEAKLADRLMDFAAIAYPLTGIPQFLQIVQSHNASGVSILSWLMFALFELIFLWYGLVHKIRPLVLTQILWLVVDAGVIIGAFIYQ